MNAYKDLTTQEFFKIETLLEQFKVYSKTNRKGQSRRTPPTHTRRASPQGTRSRSSPVSPRGAAH